MLREEAPLRPWPRPSTNDLPPVPDEVDSAVATETSRTRTPVDLTAGIPRPEVDSLREAVVVSAVVPLEFPMDSVRGRMENTSPVTGT